MERVLSFWLYSWIGSIRGDSAGAQQSWDSGLNVPDLVFFAVNLGPATLLRLDGILSLVSW